MKDMENLMNYKIALDYAEKEVKRLEGSKISDPDTFEKAVKRHKEIKKAFIRELNSFLSDEAIFNYFPKE